MAETTTQGGSPSADTGDAQPKSGLGLGRLRREKKGGGRRQSWLRRTFGMDRMFGLALLAGLLVLYAADPYIIEVIRVKTFDVYQKAKPHQVTDRPVTIIDLDEQSLAEIGQWPWPRTIVAQMIQNLMQMGAVLVAFDIVFAEPDRMNPSGVADAIYGLDDDTRAKLRALPSNDAVLAQVVKNSRVVLGQASFWEDRELKAGPPVKKSVAVKMTPGAPPPLALVPSFPDLIRNVPEVEKVATSHGIFSLVTEPDGIVRRVPSLFAYDGNLYPSLSVEMLRVATGRPTILVKTNEAGVSELAIARGLALPTDRIGRVWPYFSESDKEKYVSARDVLAGTVDPAKIQNKLTIVGTSAVGLLDIRSTPVDRVIPGVEVHAQLIETALTGEYLLRENFIVAAELSLLLFGGLLMIWLVPKVGAKWTMILFFVVAGGAAGTSWYLFSEQRIMFDAVYAVFGILILYTLLTYTGYAKEEVQRRQVRSAFGHYLSPAMVEKLAEDPDQLKLGGETRNMSMLFCDVRGFTTISEMFDAEGLTQLINKLLTPLTKVILDRQGTVDKYMGDCIMAFWNAPLDDDAHARNACLAALVMNEEMGPLNDRLAAEAEEEGRPHIPLKIGIGVNSGDVVVGNMGSDQRFDYSILGDNVNLASRLEGQCKTYAVDIVIGENTQAKIPDMATLQLDQIKVKGKTEAVTVYTVLGDETIKNGNAFPVLEEAHNKMLDAYRSQDWAAAKQHLSACRDLLDGFALGEFYDIYAERIAEYEANPPGADWDGVYVATSK